MIRELGFVENLRIGRAKRQIKAKQKPQADAPDEMKEEADQALIAAFPVSQYLGDARCQKAMLELSGTWEGKNPAAEAIIAQFHPLSTDQIKKARDLDVYFLQSIAGYFNRVHVVKKDGIGNMNPPPDDYRCESCQTKGWLRKEFKTSKLDGANTSVWLCPKCASQSSEPEDAEEHEQKGPERPKTGLRELDEDPKLFDLLGHVLGLAVKEVAQTGSLSPFAILETHTSDRLVQGFRTPRLEIGYEEARRAVLAAPQEAKRYALAWLGYITREGVRYEGILVGGGERGEERGAAIGQRYKQRPPDVKYEPIGNAMLLGPDQNLLTLSGDPDAASKLRTVVTKLTADMAHSHGPRADEALTYEMKRCQGVILDLGDIDRPFLKELQKKPDIVHVVMGRRSWLTKFGPDDKEVVLARDTLVPISGGEPFPGFNEDGLITVGYLPPEPTAGADPTRINLVVLWMTMFRITDKEIGENR
jgi:hypothetical protein